MMSQIPETSPQGDPAPAKTAPAGAPSDALTAFDAALVTAAKAAPADTADPMVSLAFALGWQMAELFRSPPGHGSERQDGDLPGLSSLSDADRREISVDQVAAGLSRLTPAITAAGLTAPTEDLAAVRAAQGSWAADGLRTVAQLHRELLGTLTAADFRLGKAYGLGRALADTCRKADNIADLSGQLGPFRVAQLLSWLDELSTVLPPHAARSVYASLKEWSGWAAAEQIPADALKTIKRQGELWRALLSGEKRGTEILEISNYLDAASNIALQMSVIAWKTIVRFWWLAAAVAALVAGTVALFVVGGASHLVAGSGTLLAAIGLTWKGLGGALGKLAGRLEQPLWGAVLDDAVAAAITLKPGNKADALDRIGVAAELSAGPGKEPSAAGASERSGSA